VTAEDAKQQVLKLDERISNAAHFLREWRCNYARQPRNERDVITEILDRFFLDDPVVGSLTDEAGGARKP